MRRYGSLFKINPSTFYVRVWFSGEKIGKRPAQNVNKDAKQVKTRKSLYIFWHKSST